MGRGAVGWPGTPSGGRARSGSPTFLSNVKAFPHAIALAGAAVTVVLLSGCSSWHQAGPSVEDVLRRKDERHLRLQLAGSEKKIEIQSPRIEGDSLHGVISTAARTPADPRDYSGQTREIRLATRAIRGVEVQRVNAAKTAVFALLVTSVMVLGALAASYSGSDVYL